MPRLIPVTPTNRAFFSEQIRVGRYDLIYRLGSGGMAAVFVGRLSGLAGFERMVAVKVIHQHLADSKKFVNMFLDEARMAASIHHPNVVEIYEVGHDRGLFFMVGEFVHGPDLGRLLRRLENKNTPLSPSCSAYIAAKVCLGLHAAHETRDKDDNPLNLIHRDISPNNVLISYDGFVKLIDFGVAWARNKLAHTESGALKGKIGYISPEQILGQTVDRRSDIFSVGVLLYIMATLSHPFPGKSDAERLNKIIAGEVQLPSRVRPDVHPGIERIILKAMAASPSDRYATAAEMAKDLETFIESLGEGVRPEDISALLSSLFKKEKQVHQSSLTAYRAARGADSSAAAVDGTSEDFFENSPNAPSENTSASFSMRLPQKKSLILSLVSLAAIAVIAVLLFTYLGNEPKDDSAVPSNAGKTTEKAHAAGAGTVTTPVVEQHKEGDISQDVGRPMKTEPSAQAPDDQLTPKEPASENKPDSMETSGLKRNKMKPKKSGSDLLHSPYS